MSTPQEAHQEFFQLMQQMALGDELDHVPDELAIQIQIANLALATYVIIKTKENNATPNIGPNGFYPNGSTED